MIDSNRMCWWLSCLSNMNILAKVGGPSALWICHYMYNLYLVPTGNKLVSDCDMIEHIEDMYNSHGVIESRVTSSGSYSYTTDCTFVL